MSTKKPRLSKKDIAYIKALCKFVNDHGPAVETDNTGQIVIYTSLMYDEDDNIVPFVDQDEQSE